MLQKVDKDRLDAVLRVIETKNWKFPMTEIHKVMGTDKGMISKYLNGKEGMSDKFYSKFMQTFGNTEGEVKGGGSLSVGDMANKLIRIEAQQSVILGTQAEILAHLTDRSVPALLRQKANEVKTMEEELRGEHGTR